jgi:hypothetical protein
MLIQVVPVPSGFALRSADSKSFNLVFAKVSHKAFAIDLEITQSEGLTYQPSLKVEFQTACFARELFPLWKNTWDEREGYICQSEDLTVFIKRENREESEPARYRLGLCYDHYGEAYDPTPSLPDVPINTRVDLTVGCIESPTHLWEAIRSAGARLAMDTISQS